MQKLQTQFVSQIVSLQSCQISGDTGVVTVAFTAANVDQFNGAMKNITDGGYFDVLTPFSITKSGTAGTYQCSATLKIRNFQSAVSNGTSGASGAASSTGGAK